MYKKAGCKLYDGQKLHRKYNLLHEIAVLMKYSGYGIHGFAEVKPWNQSGDEPDHVACIGNRRRRFEAVGSKNKSIDNYSHERLDKHPDDSEIGSHKSFPEIRLGKIQDHPPSPDDILYQFF